MENNLPLIIHNVISIVSTISLFGIAFFTYINAPRKIENISWSLMMLSITIFTISHVIGVNITDPNISRLVLMFNVCIFFIGAFNLHAVIYLTNEHLKNKWIVTFLYIISVILVIFFLLFPHLYLVNSVPKMYFPNYYEPAALNWIRIAYLYGIIVPYIVYILSKAKNSTKIVELQNQYKYLRLTIIIGYALAFIPNLLIYNIPVNPTWGMTFSVIFMIPFTYGAIKYRLFSVKVIAIEAFIYSTAVIIIGGIIVLLNYAEKLVRDSFSQFPDWIFPLMSSFLAVTTGVIIWKNLKKSDVLKYEFITTVTHKFRTPLTHIKWASENLAPVQTSQDNKMQVEYIQNATSKLVELTNLLVNISEEENTLDYKITKGNISEIVKSVTTYSKDQSSSKHIKISENIEDNLMANFDEHRIRFVIQTLIENSINYTPVGGAITVSLQKTGSMIKFSVSDNGIGIPETELPLLFSKFYRGEKAKTTDTEGMGIGLYMAKNIISHHHGKIYAESGGSGKGSTFYFLLPVID